VIAPVIFLTVVTGHLHMGDMAQRSAASAARRCVFRDRLDHRARLRHIRRQLPPARHGASTPGAKLDTVKQFAEQGKSFDIRLMLIWYRRISSAPSPRGDLIPILIIAILFGAALTAWGARQGRRGAAGKSQPRLLRIIAIVMYVAPLGVCAMAYTIGVNGVGVLVNLGELMACVYLTWPPSWVVCLGLIAKFSGFSIFKFLRYITEDCWSCSGTSSSETALPA